MDNFTLNGNGERKGWPTHKHKQRMRAKFRRYLRKHPQAQTKNQYR